MIEINIGLIATAVGIISVLAGTLWKFASSVTDFAKSVDELRESVEESKTDRRSMRDQLGTHETKLEVINEQYRNIKEDLDWMKIEIRKL